MKKTLLLADDSPTIQKVINLTFADEGIDVISVSDGNAAIQHLRELTPDLVMADVHMPGLNGYQICERIRQNAELSKVPVILLVGSFEPFDEEEAIRVGADDFLMKPFQSIRQLVSRVAALLDTDPKEAGADTGVDESPEEIEPAGETAPPAEIHTASSLTPEDVFHAPWTEQPAAVTPETPPEKIAETDDLSDFDSDFERAFPDAAALSSEQIDTTKFEPRGETAPGFEEGAGYEDTAKTQPLPEEELKEITPAETLERISDEDEEQTPVQPEAASILDLGYPDAETSLVEEDIALEFQEDAPGDLTGQILDFQTAEPEAVKTEEIAEPALEPAPSPEPEPEIAQYDFRQPDAFDEDGDIRESFHGLPVAEEGEEKPAVSFQPPAENITAAEPGGVSTDQADGFSAAGETQPAPRQVSPEAIEAIAQRVFEKLSEKMVKEMVPEMKDLIARELAGESLDKNEQ